MTRSARGILSGLVCCLASFFATVPAIHAEPAPMRHEAEIRLDPANGNLEVRHSFQTLSRGPVVFALAPWLEVRSARLDGENASAAREGNLWRVAEAAGPGVSVELLLEGRVPSLAGAESGVAAGAAVSGAEGSYLPGSARWLADTGDFPSTYRLTIEVPASQRAVATGRLLEESATDADYRAVFLSDGALEPPALFAGPYEIAERESNGLRLRTYFHGELADWAGDYLDAAAAYIARFEAEIGDYPTQDFHIVSAPLPVGLGFPGLTYIDRRIVPLPFMRARSLAHEVLHNWWGNGVAVDYATGNWAEGLTTYQADYALAAEQGPDAGREMRLGWLRDYAALPPQRDVPAALFTAKTHDAAQVVGYGKVAYVFHMLRREIGADAFGAGLRGFWQQHRRQVAGWADLREAFEDASGQDLGWFFAQWIDRAGAPRIDLAQAAASETSGGHTLSLRLLQSEPLYRTRLPVMVETDGGAVRREVVLERADQTVSIELAERPLIVRVDPDFETFRRLLPGESPPILRDVTLSEQAVVVLPESGDSRFRNTAKRLAERLLPNAPEVLSDPEAVPLDAPVLFIASDRTLESLPAEALSGGRSEVLEAGTARAWTFRDRRSRPWLVVTAADTDALEAVLRPLPHYRSRSYVVFEGGKAVRKGIWSQTDSPLSRRLDG